MNLGKCPRCSLIFVIETNPFHQKNKCPFCLRRTTNQEEIVDKVGGLTGDERVILLRNERIKTGVDSLQLGDMCEHGRMTSTSCNDCEK